MYELAGRWRYLFRAVDKHGRLIASMLSGRRDTGAAYRFLRKALRSMSDYPPSSITTDKLASYPKAILRLQNEGLLSKDVEHRTSKYLNNILEADHGALKRVIRPTRGFQTDGNSLRHPEGLRGDADDPSRPLQPDTAWSDRRNPPHEQALRPCRLNKECGGFVIPFQVNATKPRGGRRCPLGLRDRDCMAPDCPHRVRGRFHNGNPGRCLCTSRRAMRLGLVNQDKLAARLGRNAAFDRAGNLFIAAWRRLLVRPGGRVLYFTWSPSSACGRCGLSLDPKPRD